MAKRRRVFEQGHERKFLVIVDESPEVEAALFYAACRVAHTHGHLLLLYVIEPETQFWDSVRQAHLEEQTAKAKALFRLFKRMHGRDDFGGGVGAGLTIVQKLVQRHGGRVWLDSVLGVGTTFYFTLPGQRLGED